MEIAWRTPGDKTVGEKKYMHYAGKFGPCDVRGDSSAAIPKCDYPPPAAQYSTHPAVSVGGLYYTVYITYFNNYLSLLLVV